MAGWNGDESTGCIVLVFSVVIALVFSCAHWGWLATLMIIGYAAAGVAILMLPWFIAEWLQ